LVFEGCHNLFNFSLVQSSVSLSEYSSQILSGDHRELSRSLGAYGLSRASGALRSPRKYRSSNERVATVLAR
jgi:hypothetical protein